MAQQISVPKGYFGQTFNQGKSLSIPLLSVACFLLIDLGTTASAQIVPDRTLPNNSVAIPDDNLIEITGGTTAGSNLFHSFEQFSLSTGDTAFFNNALAIDNIISRVTGGSISNIDGLIRANGTANLFLINPNGIIFGQNAALNIGGSFIGSTADSLKFSDGSEFSAVNLQEAPLLTVNIPVGLQYGGNPGDITVMGSGNNLSLDKQTFAVIRDTRPVGLEVNSGETLALVGGNVNLEGGNITASEGRIELGSVGAGETVELIPIDKDKGWKLDYTDVSSFRELTLSQAASADTSGNSGGDVHLQASRIKITDGSAILADTLGDGTGGTITAIASEAIEAIGTAANNPFLSGIYANVDIGVSGRGGNLTIETENLSLRDGAQFSTGTFGLGDAGNLSITAQNIEVIGGTPIGPSGLFAPVAPFAEGNGGNLMISTDTLRLKDGAQIFANTFGIGNAGNLNIQAREIEVIGFNPGGPSALFSSTESPAPSIVAEGNGGNLNIVTDTLRIADGGQISTGSIGLGNGGVLDIQAQEIELSGKSPFGNSGLFSSSLFLTGNGGDINITTNKLDIRDSATIGVSNFHSSNRIPPGSGKAGNITINANSLELDRTSSEIPSSITASTNSQAGGNITLNVDSVISVRNGSQITSESRGDGDGGKIALTADTLELNSGGLLSTNTMSSGNAGTINLTIDTANFSDFGSAVKSEVEDSATGDGGNIAITAKNFNLNNQAQVSTNSSGLGQAGNIKITANDEINTDRGTITATSTQTGGGNINLATDFLFLENNSLISTSVLDSTGGGGNLTIDSNYIIAQDNSDLRANAVLGQGGNIDITTEVILFSLDSDIDASSEFGLDGVVEIKSPDFDQQIGIVRLDRAIADPTGLITSTCVVEQNDVMVVAGRGGLSENPSQTLRGESVWEDLRDFSASREVAQNTSREKITEANSWTVNDKGNIELLSYVPVSFNKCREIQ